MKAITCLIGLFLLFLASPAKASPMETRSPWSINSGIHGRYRKLQPNGHLLSPSMEDKKYTGPGLRGNE